MLDRHARDYLSERHSSIAADFHVPFVTMSDAGVRIEYDGSERLELQIRVRDRLLSMGITRLTWSMLDCVGIETPRPRALVKWRYFSGTTVLETARLRYFFLEDQSVKKIHMIERVHFTLLDPIAARERLVQ